MESFEKLPNCGAGASPLKVAQALQKFCLVIEGDEALPFWRTTSSAGRPAWHGHSVCLGCLQFAVRGCCSHQYATFVASGLVGVL